jgi:exodeoxyribonuclease VII large subunit
MPTFGLEELLFGGGSGAALSVSHFTWHLASLVREDVILQDVWVRGEVSNITRAASGHLYFSLKDQGACVGCAMWRTSACRARFRLEPGMQVLAHGAVDIYAPRGQYQLIVDELRTDGAGSLHLSLERVKQRLLAEGLLDAGRKRPLPLFPQRVAVITSLSGAAVRDICVTLQRDPFPPEIVLVPALVQGDGSEESLCCALRLANAESGADVIILGRGGGSTEDLWSFNSEAVSRAVVSSRVPVISAVGHETDFTLADLAADLRAPTPTAAAEMLVAQRADAVRRVDIALRRVQAQFGVRVEMARMRLEALQRRPPLARPLWIVETRRQQLDETEDRLQRAGSAAFTRWRHRLALAAGKMDGLSPLSTLARGYATVLRLPQEEPVASVSALTEGDRVRVRLADGAFESRVTRVTGDAEGKKGP